jgi:carbamoyl-phosphate synthase small subunit
MADPALLALEDGTLWQGIAMGAPGERTGEVVFNTSMAGYQETLTDPSYYGQIVVMTTAHVGNTGVNGDDDESARAWLSGFAVREASRRASSWRANQSLDDYLRERNVVGIAGLDTRSLVRHIRSQGALRGALGNDHPDPGHLLSLSHAAPPMNGLDLVHSVTCTKPFHWSRGADAPWNVVPPTLRHPAHAAFHVVAFDYGIKHNILCLLTSHGCRVTVVPANQTAAEVIALKPDGIFLSNGPGDPAAVTYAVDTVRQLLGRVPIFGICLGHQILGLALGATTYKLKFGHRGGNQPVKNLLTGRVEITTHNHGFAVSADSLPPELEITHLNLNDQCIEGLRSREHRAFSVQFHPEAAPGPHDAIPLFDEFIALMGSRPSLSNL